MVGEGGGGGGGELSAENWGRVDDESSLIRYWVTSVI